MDDIEFNYTEKRNVDMDGLTEEAVEHSSYLTEIFVELCEQWLEANATTLMLELIENKKKGRPIYKRQNASHALDKCMGK